MVLGGRDRLSVGPTRGATPVTGMNVDGDEAGTPPSEAGGAPELEVECPEEGQEGDPGGDLSGTHRQVLRLVGWFGSAEYGAAQGGP